MPTPIRILVIEDDVMVAFAVVAILQDEGWIVVGPIDRLEPTIEASARAGFDCAVVDADLDGVFADRVAINLHKRGKPFLLATGHEPGALKARQRRRHWLGWQTCSTPTMRLGMSWQQTPRDDGWKRVTLASVAGLGQQIWLRCNGCGHEQHVDPLAFAAFHDLDAATPLLTIGQRLRCTTCGEHKAHCWPHQAYRSGGGSAG